MAYKNQQTSVTLEAGADLSANQFHFVTMDSDGQLSVSTDGAASVGVLLNDPSAAGRAAEVCIGGLTRVEAGGTIAAGADVASGATGEAITAATGDAILGTAVTGGADGEVISIIFQPRGVSA
jgi:hypothetical protein